MTRAKVTLRERRAKRDLLGKVMVATSFIVIVGVFCISSFMGPVKRDGNLCIYGEKPKAFNIIIVDKTDVYGANFRRQVENLILEKADSIGMDELIEIYLIRGSFSKRDPAVISLCNPGKGSQYNRLFHNQDKKQKIYDVQYIGKLKDSLEMVTKKEESSQSPILEVVYDIATKRVYSRDNIQKSIVLVSDMAQNTDKLAFVDDYVPIEVTDEDIQKGIAAIAGTQGLNFRNFNFEVHQVEEMYGKQAIDHVKALWENIIKKSGGTLRPDSWKLL